MMKPLPAGWGADALTDYLETHRSNQFATFANKHGAMGDLIKIDSLFNRFLNGAINPRPLYPMGFMLRAHSGFRASVGAVIGGQLFESHALLRLCLEHAAYGFYVGSDADRMERWLRRNDSEESRKAVRREFHNDRIREYIEASSLVMRQHFDHHYSQLIEFGAHPNERGYSLNTTVIRNEAGDTTIETTYLHADGARLDDAIKVAAQIGLWALHLMQLLYRERFELLGIRADLEDLRTRF